MEGNSMQIDALKLNSLKDLLPDKPKFNIMDVFRLGKSELAHSNFISYILKGNHNSKPLLSKDLLHIQSWQGRVNDSKKNK